MLLMLVKRQTIFQEERANSERKERGRICIPCFQPPQWAQQNGGHTSRQRATYQIACLVFPPSYGRVDHRVPEIPAPPTPARVQGADLRELPQASLVLPS